MSPKYKYAHVIPDILAESRISTFGPDSNLGLKLKAPTSTAQLPKSTRTNPQTSNLHVETLVYHRRFARGWDRDRSYAARTTLSRGSRATFWVRIRIPTL